MIENVTCGMCCQLIAEETLGEQRVDELHSMINVDAQD
jgi:hypothetical protein